MLASSGMNFSLDRWACMPAEGMHEFLAGSLFFCLACTSRWITESLGMHHPHRRRATSRAMELPAVTKTMPRLRRCILSSLTMSRLKPET